MSIVDKARFLLVQTLSKNGQEETSCPSSCPITPETAETIAEEFIERAGIAEYHGGLSRVGAERLAVKCLARRWHISECQVEAIVRPREP